MPRSIEIPPMLKFVNWRWKRKNGNWDSIEGQHTHRHLHRQPHTHYIHRHPHTHTHEQTKHDLYPKSTYIFVLKENCSTCIIICQSLGQSYDLNESKESDRNGDDNIHK